MKAWKWRLLTMVLASLVGEGRAQAQPRELVGKSVIVEWREAREHQREGDAVPRSMSAHAIYSLYISPAGKSFGRLTIAAHGGGIGRRQRVGSSDTVSGEHERRTPRFRAGGFSIGFKRGQAGAMLVDVSLSGGSCSAKVLAGKTEGAAGMGRTKSLVSGGRVIVHSLRVSGETCRIVDGNVFDR